MHTKFEDVDRKIIACLAKTPRARNSEIGAQLGLRPAFVTSRIRSMMENGHLRVIAFADARVFGYHQIARVQVRTIGVDIEALARNIASDSRCLSVELTTGVYQLNVLFGLNSLEDFSTTANKFLADLGGVLTFRSQLIRSLFRCEPGGMLPI